MIFFKKILTKKIKKISGKILFIFIIIIIFFGKTLGLTSAPGCNKRGLKHKSECVTELISLKEFIFPH
jgi:hypothetical protein